MATKDKAQYSKPASQVDLEARLENGNKSNAVLSTADAYEAPEGAGDGRDFRVDGNEVTNYVGTSPEYATYANDTEAPLAADDDSAEAKVFASFAGSPVPAVLRIEGNVEYDGEVKSKEEAAPSAASEEPEASDPAVDLDSNK